MTPTRRNLTFAETEDGKLTLDLYLPPEIDRPPLVVWIHGGGWRSGSKNKPPVRKLVHHGYALASISYRFTDQQIFPAQIHDCKAAIRWLRAHEPEYGYDSSWIAVAGSSAGAHLAMLLGTSAKVESLEGVVGGNLGQSSAVQAVVNYYGPSDFVLRGQTQPERAYTELSGSFSLLGGVKFGAIDPALESLASPVTHVTSESPPLLSFHGGKDETVLLDQAERIVQVYRDQGLSTELIVLPEAQHGGLEFFWGENFDQLVSFLATSRQ